MAEFIPVLSKEVIQKAVANVARRISSDYSGCEPVLIGVLKGAFLFMADLIRYLTIPVHIDFVRAASYGTGTRSSENIQLTKGIEIDVRNRDILLIEDIVDTGLTLAFLVDYLESFGPKTVHVCTLVDKQERRKTTIDIDYVCHVIKKGYLVGYGLDYAEKYRELPEIFQLKL